MSDQFTPQEQFLIERLVRAPQPDLNQAVFEAIRVRMLDALDSPPIPAPQPVLPPPTIVVVILVVIATIAAIIAVVVSQQNPSPVTSTTPIVTSSPLAAPSVTPVVTASPTPTTTITVTPLPTPTPTVESLTVIEGTVEAIDGTVITIFGVQVRIAADDPLLGAIQIGDVIRVEGSIESTGDTMVILAATIIHVNIDVNVNPATGEVWRDDGTCLNPPPDWALAHGWRRRCLSSDSNRNDDRDDSGKSSRSDDDD